MPANISISNKPPVIEVAELVEQAMEYVDGNFEIDMHVNCHNSFITADICYYDNEPVRIPVYGRYMDKSVDETVAEIMGQAIVAVSQAAANMSF